MKKNLLIMFAKAPVPGKVKTRLQPPLSPAQAAGLHQAFMLDQAERLLAPGRPGREGWVSAAGSLEHPAFEEIAAMGVPLLRQEGEGLGDRMACAIEAGLGAGFETVTLMGSDSPTLPWSLVEGAVASLDGHEACLCPSFDGGFVLISARCPLPALRGPIPWSVEETLARTAEALREKKVLVALGGFWYDVDQGEDLGFLARHLSALGAPVPAPRTASWLEAHRGLLGPLGFAV